MRMRVFRDGAPPAAGDDAAGVERTSRVRANLTSVKAVVAFASARGGAGKSSIMTNLAAALAQSGRKVGIVDADLNSPSIVAMLGMKPPRGIMPAEWIDPNGGPLGLRVVGSNLLPDVSAAPISFLEVENPVVEGYGNSNGVAAVETGYSAGIAQLLSRTRFGQLDLLLIDLPPGIEAFARILDLVPDAALTVVSQPSELSARANKGLISFAHERGVTVIGMVENMAGFSCDSCHTVRPLMPQGGVAVVAAGLGVPLLERLPFDPRFAETCDRGVLFVREYSESPLAKQLTGLAQAVDRGANPRMAPSGSAPFAFSHS
jgi:ATP-binding protein involved in chromosome partitioning